MQRFHSRLLSRSPLRPPIVGSKWTCLIQISVGPSHQSLRGTSSHVTLFLSHPLQYLLGASRPILVPDHSLVCNTIAGLQRLPKNVQPLRRSLRNWIRNWSQSSSKNGNSIKVWNKWDFTSAQAGVRNGDGTRRMASFLENPAKAKELIGIDTNSQSFTRSSCLSRKNAPKNVQIQLSKRIRLLPTITISSGMSIASRGSSSCSGQGIHQILTQLNGAGPGWRDEQPVRVLRNHEPRP